MIAPWSSISGSVRRVRRLVVKLGEKGWSQADIAYALREIAEEVELGHDPEAIKRPSS